MYNFYLHSTTTLSVTVPNSVLYGNYTSNQFLAWSVMQSACQWVSQVSPTIHNNNLLTPFSDYIPN